MRVWAEGCSQRVDSLALLSYCTKQNSLGGKIPYTQSCSHWPVESEKAQGNDQNGRAVAGALRVWVNRQLLTVSLPFHSFCRGGGGESIGRV